MNESVFVCAISINMGFPTQSLQPYPLINPPGTHG